MVDRNVVPEVPTNQKRAVGVYKDPRDLEGFLKAAKDANFDMSKISLLSRNVEGVEGAREVTEHEGNEAKEGAAAGATTGTVLGGVGGWLVGVGLLAIPGVGPVLAAGAEISALASTLAGAGIGAAAGGIIGALVGLGIPEEKAKVYNERVKAGNHLVIVTGSEDEINRMESIMRNNRVDDFEIFDATPDRDSIPTADADIDRDVDVDVHRKQNVQTRNTVVTDTKEIKPDHDPDVIIVDERKC